MLPNPRLQSLTECVVGKQEQVEALARERNTLLHKVEYLEVLQLDVG